MAAYGLGLLIVRPLDRLTRGAAAVAGGDLKVDLPVIGTGEVGYLTRVFNDMVIRLRQSREELERLSVTDGLTGLWNRRNMMQRLTAEAERSRRAGLHFAVLMADVDHFKGYNDAHGHLAGDDVLIRVAAILREAVRESDTAARYGGEEFLVLLTDTGMDGAVEVAERARARLARESFAGGPVTISVGVAAYPEFGTTAEALIMSADVALYQAKKLGRDRVVRATAAPAEETPNAG
jgi:diguanylate cyclase (GGDEF)-like protein